LYRTSAQIYLFHARSVYFRFAFVQCICSDRIDIIASIVWALSFTRNHLAHGYLVIISHYCVYFNCACPKVKLFLLSFIYLCFRIDHFNHELIKLCDNAFKRKQNREFAHEDKFGNIYSFILLY